MRNFLISCLVILALMSSCNSTHETEKLKEEIKQTDLEFSDYSAKFGMNKAFVTFFDSAGVLLRPNQYPIEGLEKIKMVLSKRSDTTFTLTWKPTFADVSSSGDLGYTYGIWEVVLEDTSFKGTYATIWRKNKQGKWKMVLDTGNDGLSE